MCKKVENRKTCEKNNILISKYNDQHPFVGQNIQLFLRDLSECHNSILGWTFAPKKVTLAINIAVSDKALVLEVVIAVGTLEAFGVPVLIQDPENKPVQDHHSTSSALGNGSCNGNKTDWDQNTRTAQRHVSIFQRNYTDINKCNKWKRLFYFFRRQAFILD